MWPKSRMTKIIKNFSNSADSAVEAGNTRTASKTEVKQVNPSVRWVFTLNNYTEEQYSSIKQMVIFKCKFAIIGKEHVGMEEYGLTPHLQGYVEFKKKQRPIAVFGFISTGMHWEKARAKRVKQNYCEKEGDVWKFPDAWKQEIAEWWGWEKMIIEELNIQPDNRTINWIWESTGVAGKTVFQKWVHQHFKGVMALSGCAADMKNGIIEYEKTNDELPKIIFINLPRVQGGHLSYSGMEQVKDMFFYSGKYEGGMVNGPSPHVYVFANEEPERSNLSSDRWRIYEIDGLNIEE